MRSCLWESGPLDRALLLNRSRSDERRLLRRVQTGEWRDVRTTSNEPNRRDVVSDYVPPTLTKFSISLSSLLLHASLPQPSHDSYKMNLASHSHGILPRTLITLSVLEFSLSSNSSFTAAGGNLVDIEPVKCRLPKAILYRLNLCMFLLHRTLSCHYGNK